MNEQQDADDQSLVYFKDTAYDRYGKSFDKLIGDTMNPFYVHGVAAPNFWAGRTKVSPTIERAFDVEAHFRNGGRSAAKRARTHELSGYALMLEDTLPIDTEDRLRALLPRWNQRLGTSMFRVKSLPGALQGFDNEQIRKLNLAARRRLPELIGPSHRITLEQIPGRFGGSEHVLYVTGNDVPAAARLYRKVASRARTQSPYTVAELLKDRDYENMNVLSQCARDQMALDYSKALGFELDNNGRAELTSWHYSTARANTMAHGERKSRTNTSHHYEPGFVVVYNNATPTHSSYQGVIMSHGLMGGHTVLRTDDGSPWYRPGELSLMPATSMRLRSSARHSRAYHKKESSESECAFRSRVAWRTDLSEHHMHPFANESYASLDDEHSRYWLQSLSPADTSHTHRGPLKKSHSNFVTGQLPSITTLHADLATLISLSRDARAPPVIRVAFDNDVVLLISKNWDRYVLRSDYKARTGVEPGDVFANTETRDVTTAGFWQLDMRSQCRNHQHQHFPAEPRATSAGAIIRNSGDEDADSEGTEYSDLAQPTQPITIINLDKELIQVITPDGDALVQRLRAESEYVVSPLDDNDDDNDDDSNGDEVSL